jgi:hypothetical protein
MMEPFGIDILICLIWRPGRTLTRSKNHDLSNAWKGCVGAKNMGRVRKAYRNDFSSTSQDKGIAEGMLQSTVWRANYG